MIDTTRRQFTGMIAAGSALPLVGPVQAAPGSAPTPGERDLPWYADVRRVGQINTNQRDLANFDVKRFADQMLDCGCQAVVLSVGNIRAFYPTQVPHYLLTPGAEKRDLVRECVDALRARKIRIITRLSPDMQPTEVAKQRPEWFRRTRNGELISFLDPIREVPPGTRDTGAGMAQNTASTCSFTTYYSEQIPAIIEELQKRYQPDGVYMNGWPNGGVAPCWCAACQKIGDPTTPAYVAAADRRAVELWKIYLQAARSRNPEAFVAGNLMTSLAGNEDRMFEITKDFPWLTIDHQMRGPVNTPVWEASQGARTVKSFAKDRTVAIVTAARNSGWRQATGERAEVTSRMIQTTAAGATIWHHWLGYNEGFLYDRRWQTTEREFLRWHARNDAHFRNLAPLANLGVILSPQTNRLYKSAHANANMQATLEGVFAILNDARLPFDLVQDINLDAENLRRFTALLLPNVAMLSDRQRDQLAAFVARGGSLVSTFETGLYDENGNARADFALAELHGVNKAGERETRLRHGAPAGALYRLTERHPILSGFQDTAWIEGSEWNVPIRTAEKPLLKHIPAYPWYPTDLAIVPVEEAVLPVAVARQSGAARLVYLSGNIESCHWTTGGGDLADLLASSVRWALNDTLPVRVEGEGLVEIFGWRTHPGYAVHIINHNNPYAFRKSLRRVTPIGPQRVTLAVESGVKVREARLLRAERGVPFRQNGQTVVVDVPGVKDYEVVALMI